MQSINLTTDVCVIGGGPAGIGAALAAANQGLEVCLVEASDQLGGRASLSAVGTICGLYLALPDRVASYIMPGFPKHFAEQVQKINKQPVLWYKDQAAFLPCLPDDFELTAKHFMQKTGLSVRLSHKVNDVQTSTNQIKTVRGIFPSGTWTLKPRSVVDCSGRPLVSEFAEHPIMEDDSYQSGAQVFVVKNLPDMEASSLQLILLRLQRRLEVKAGEKVSLSLIPGSLTPGKAWLKLGFTGTDNHLTNSSLLKQKVEKVFSQLQQLSTIFEQASIAFMAPEKGIRSGPRYLGKDVLCENDVLTGKRLNHSVGRGCWPIEYWHPDGALEMIPLPHGTYYDIPAGAISSPQFENLFFAGKNISAEARALASSRVMGTCLGLGYAAGILASARIKNLTDKKVQDIIKREVFGENRKV